MRRRPTCSGERASRRPARSWTRRLRRDRLHDREAHRRTRPRLRRPGRRLRRRGRRPLRQLEPGGDRTRRGHRRRARDRVRLRTGEQLRLRRVGRLCRRDRARGRGRARGGPRSRADERDRPSVPGRNGDPPRRPGAVPSVELRQRARPARRRGGRPRPRAHARAPRQERRAMCRRDRFRTCPGRPRRRRDATAVPRPRPLLRKAHPLKSYAVAARSPRRTAPRGMYISADEPKRSVRSTPAGDGRRVLIVGGEGGRLGRGPRRDGALRQAGALPAGTVRRRGRVPLVDPRLRPARRAALHRPAPARRRPGPRRDRLREVGDDEGDARRDDADRRCARPAQRVRRPLHGHAPRRAAIRLPLRHGERPRRARVRARPCAAPGWSGRTGRARAGRRHRLPDRNEALRRPPRRRRPAPLALGPLSPPGLHRRLECRPTGPGSAPVTARALRPTGRSCRGRRPRIFRQILVP